MTTPNLSKRDGARLGAEPAPSSERLRCARIRRLRWIARVRKRYGWLLLALPLVLVITVDVLMRGDRLAELRGKYLASYAAAMVESALLWGLLLHASSHRRGVFRWVAAAAFVSFAALAIGGQIYFHRQYATYLNLDATLFGTSFSESLFGQLRADASNFVTSVAPPFAFAIALVWLSRRALRARPKRKGGRFAVVLSVIAVFLIPCSYRTVQASTPDVIYFHALGGLIKELTGVRTTAQVRPGLRSPPALAPVVRAPARLTPNVLMILTESVRADVSCSAPDEDCEATPETNAAAPNRFPLRRMHSNASTTAIELAVLWSGLEPTESREALHEAPLLFDYAAAAGIDSAYWTSHHMMFANSRLFVQDLPTSQKCGATDLDPLADIDLGASDFLLTERAARDLPKLREPFFAVVHFGNTHVPYWADPEDSPFQPSIDGKAPSDNEAYRNYYKNAVHRQDKAIAELIRFVRQSPMSDRTVLLYTSDHGEAFREHDQLGHTGSVLEEEIHVPGFIDAPPGVLDESERTALASAEDRIVFHTDITPTVLDLMGLGDEPSFAAYRTKMVGSSLLRPAGPPVALGLTNCSEIWGCAFQNWGMMRGAMKLEAREWDADYHCYDVLADPKEQNDLGPAACGDLAERANATFGGLPSAP